MICGLPKDSDAKENDPDLIEIECESEADHPSEG